MEIVSNLLLLAGINKMLVILGASWPWFGGQPAVDWP